MNKTNERIFGFLNKYINTPDPNYAVMLSGDWGCGKTYFVKHWCESVAKGIENDKTSTLSKPIYVSLFGLSSVKEINEAVTKEIYPFMKSKIYELGKTALNAVSSVALNCDLSKLTKDKFKGEANLELDIVSLFKSETKVNDNRIIIFDDFERCKAPIVDLIGYINSFVEHSNIRVILICNEKVFAVEDRKEDKVCFDSFKEKIVGRAFQVEADVEDAIQYFCDNSSLISLTDNQKRIAADTFLATRYNNIRILYQALQDYCQLINTVHFDLTVDHHKKIIDGLLVQYIVAYNEYANSDKVREMAQYEPSQFNLLDFSILAGAPDKEESAEIVHKYESIDAFTPQGSMFGVPMQWILNSLRTGLDISDVIEDLLAQKNEEQPLSQRLSKYRMMEQSEFDSVYKEALEYVRYSGSDIIQIIQIISTLISIDENGIRACETTVLDEAQENIRCLLRKTVDVDSLRNIAEAFQNHKRIEVQYARLPERVKQFIDDAEMLVKKRYNELEGEEIKQLEKVTDDSFDMVSQKFFQHFGATTTCRYSLIPYFNRLDPGAFSSSLIALSNRHKVEIGNLIVGRYELQKQGEINRKYGAEVDNLVTIRDNLNESAKQKEGIDKYNIENLAHQIDTVINYINFC